MIPKKPRTRFLKGYRKDYTLKVKAKVDHVFKLGLLKVK